MIFFKRLLSFLLKRNEYKIARKYNLISVNSGLYYLKSLGYNPISIIDVGAFEGYWSKSASKIFTSSKFYLFEPQSDKSNIINKNMYGTNLNLSNQLLGALDNELVSFYKMGTGSSYYPENTDAERIEISLKTLTLDTFVSSNKIELNNSILKLDTQGSELDILKGAKSSLKEIDFILIELSLVNYNFNAPSYLEILNYLEKEDFVLFDILEIHRSIKNSLPIQFDGIFVNVNSEFYRKNVVPTNFI
jgi:FkbM family methyltransferase